MSEYDHIFVKVGGQSSRNKYHLPNPDDPSEPRCYQATHRGDYVRKTREQVPNTDICKKCAGTDETGQHGSKPQLASQVRNMDTPSLDD